jgi:hypothetical protein
MSDTFGIEEERSCIRPAGARTNQPRATPWVRGTVMHSPRRGQDKPAQGNALGERNHHVTLALKGRYKRRLVSPFQG